MDRQIKVMLVDDESAIRSVLRQTIPWEKYQMEVAGEAGSGVEALHEMERVNPDFVITDIKMPFMDGIAFSRIVLEQNPDLPIFIITAYEEFELAREALRVGVTDFFLKPVSMDELDEKLRKVQKTILDREKQKREQVIIRVENPEKTVPQINSYVYAHYEEPELNVAYIAKVFGFDRSYLSRMYKKETGRLLIDFIIQRRMEIAQKLAATGQKMYRVAEKVGIPDAGYFGKCFKKYVGVSYREYQKSLEEQECNKN